MLKIEIPGTSRVDEHQHISDILCVSADAGAKSQQYYCHQQDS